MLRRTGVIVGDVHPVVAIAHTDSASDPPGVAVKVHAATLAPACRRVKTSDALVHVTVALVNTNVPTCPAHEKVTLVAVEVVPPLPTVYDAFGLQPEKPVIPATVKLPVGATVIVAKFRVIGVVPDPLVTLDTWAGNALNNTLIASTLAGAGTRAAATSSLAAVWGALEVPTGRY